MAATPVDEHGEHSEEFEQLAGLAALDVLEGDELARFEHHADHCERCRVMVRLDRQTLAHVSLAAAPMDPSPDFKTRVMQRAAAEVAASTAPVREAPGAPIPFRPRPPNVVLLWRRSPWLSTLAAILVVGLLSLGAYSYENQPVATYELSGSVPGNAVVVVRRSGAAELQMSGVPDPQPGFLYEAWVIPQGGQPVAAGTTTTGNRATVALPGNVRGSTVAVTQERSRVEVPTPPILMKGDVQS